MHGIAQRTAHLALLTSLLGAASCDHGSKPTVTDAAVCGDATCGPGEVCDTATETCRAPRRCADVDCEQHQLCDEPEGEDAVCRKACEDGFVYVSGIGCREAAASCEAAACSQEQRLCVESNGAFACGGCIDDFVEVNSQCVAFVACTELDCQAQGRDCAEDPNGHCVGCAAGLVDDQGTCRPPKSCAQIACSSGVCNETDGSGDAFCSDTCEGFRQEIPGTGLCRFCGDCDELAASGLSTGHLLAGQSAQGLCSCEPAPGHYIDQASASIRACDQDGDGWISESAQASIAASDKFIRSSSACQRRVIRAFVLHADAASRSFPEGGTREVQVAVPLVELDRNDSDEALAFDRKRNALPSGYGSDETTGPSAAELNSLTKFCTTPRADFNGDSNPDVDQAWGGGLDSSRWGVYQRFAYFAELHWGYWEAAPAGTDCGLGADAHPKDLCGRYHIAERPRKGQWPDGSNAQDDRIAFQYVEGRDGDYLGVGSLRPEIPQWQQCERRLDKAYLGSTPTAHTMDLAEFSQDRAAGFAGMRHHSQFKCVRIVGQEDSAAADDTQLQVLTEQEVAESAGLAEHARFQTCSLLPARPSDGIGPRQPRFSCQPVPTQPALKAGDVRWLAVTYDATRTEYTPTAEFEADPALALQHSPDRGCINECASQRELPPEQQCPGSMVEVEPDEWEKGPRGPQHCSADAQNFGRLVCGCGQDYGGSGCEVVCRRDPSTQQAGYFTSAPCSQSNSPHCFDWNGDPGDTSPENGSPRKGFWACLHPTQTQPLTYEWESHGSTYTLRGSVPQSGLLRTELRSPVGSTKNYTVR